MRRRVVAAVIIAAALAAWYWDSPWPVAVAAVLIAIGALDLARSTARATSVLALVARGRPMQMRWSFSVVLTERAFDAMGFPAEHRRELMERLGEYKPFYKNPFFEGHPAPEWMSNPVTVSYERWGESLERWTILNSWISTEFGQPPAHHDKRVLEFLPAVDEAEIVHLWGDVGGLHFRYEDGRLMLLNVDRNSSLMPDGKLYVKDKERILFTIPVPSLSMSRAEWTRSNDPNSLDRFVAPDRPGAEGFDPFRYLRWHGKERFECEDWEMGFRWDLEVNDLRPTLRARVTWVQRSLWPGSRVKGIWVELEDSGIRFVANPLVVEPASDGRTLPKRGEFVWVVLGNEDERVDRIWLRFP